MIDAARRRRRSRGGARRAALLGALLGAAGCLRVGALPAIEYYVLAVPPEPPDDWSPATGGAVLAGTLAITPFETPGIYGDRRIVFRIDDTQLHAYPSREWATPLGAMLGMVTERVLGARPLTARRAIFDPPAIHSSHTYIWSGRVREFEEVDRGMDVFAAVAFDVMILRTPSDSVIWTGSTRLERHVPQPTMAAIVDALSALTADAIAQLADSARSALRVPAASTARPPG